MASKVEEEEEEEEVAVHNDDEDTGAQIAPIVRLEEVSVTTGEEDSSSSIYCQTFMEKFQEVAESQSAKEESGDKDTSADAAGLLEKLSVEEKKNGDVLTEKFSKEETPAANEPTKSADK